MDTDTPETDDAVPTSNASRKRRRQIYAWRGAAIGAVAGILVVGSMAFVLVKSSDPWAIDAMGYLLGVLSAPVGWFFGIIMRFLTTVSNEIGLSGQWAQMVMGSLIMFLSIPLNWGMFGFIIGWLFGNSPGYSSTENMSGALRPWDLDK